MAIRPISAVKRLSFGRANLQAVAEVSALLGRDHAQAKVHSLLNQDMHVLVRHQGRRLAATATVFVQPQLAVTKAWLRDLACNTGLPQSDEPVVQRAAAIARAAGAKTLDAISPVAGFAPSGAVRVCRAVGRAVEFRRLREFGPIRLATLGDIENLARLLPKPASLSPQVLSHITWSTYRKVLVWQEGGIIRGTATVVLQPELYDSRAWLEDLFVLPGPARQQIAQRLVMAATSEAANWSAERLERVCDAGVDPWDALCRQAGFTPATEPVYQLELA